MKKFLFCFLLICVLVFSSVGAASAVPVFTGTFKGGTTDVSTLNPTAFDDGNMSTYTIVPQESQPYTYYFLFDVASGATSFSVYPDKFSPSSSLAFMWKNSSGTWSAIQRLTLTNGAANVISIPSSAVSYEVFNDNSSKALWIDEISYSSTLIAPTTPPPDVTNAVAAPVNYSAIGLSWSNPSSNYFTGVYVYRNGVQIADVTAPASGYNDNGLSPGTAYSYTLKSHDSFGNVAAGVSVSSSTGTPSTPPPTPTGLAGSAGDGTVSLSWNAVNAPYLKGYFVYENGKKLSGQVVTSSSTNVTGLSDGTTYSFSVSAIDVYGNESGQSNAVSLTPVYTPVPPSPPSTPTGLVVSPYNGSLSLTWNANPEKDVSGYNVYVNGSKVNSTLTGDGYVLSGLTNGTSYTIQISAVNAAGLESALTSPVSSSPDASKLPLVSLNFNLVDLTTSIGNWFASTWLILAFAVSIPLALMIATRLRDLMIRTR